MMWFTDKVQNDATNDASGRAAIGCSGTTDAELRLAVRNQGHVPRSWCDSEDEVLSCLYADVLGRRLLPITKGHALNKSVENKNEQEGYSEKSEAIKVPNGHPSPD